MLGRCDLITGVHKKGRLGALTDQTFPSSGVAETRQRPSRLVALGVGWTACATTPFTCSPIGMTAVLGNNDPALQANPSKLMPTKL